MCDRTTTTMTVLAMVGSLRRDSVNRRLLDIAAAQVPVGVELRHWEGLRDVPPFSKDDEDDEDRVGGAVAELRRLVGEADAVLVATPEYNGSLPAQLKNALD